MIATADISEALQLASVEQLNAELERRQGAPARRFSMVVALVASQTGISVEAIAGRGRSRTVALARQLAMFLLRVRFGLSYTEIGSAFARDHRTVMFAISGIGERRLRDTVLADLLQRLDNGVSALVQSLAPDSQIYHFAAETGVSAPGSTRSAAPSCAPGNP